MTFSYQFISELQVAEMPNSLYRSYQQLCHINEAKGPFCIELTLNAVLHVVLNKRKCSTPIRFILLFSNIQTHYDMILAFLPRKRRVDTL